MVITLSVPRHLLSPVQADPVLPFLLHQVYCCVSFQALTGPQFPPCLTLPQLTPYTSSCSGEFHSGPLSGTCLALGLPLQITAIALFVGFPLETETHHSSL